MATTVDRAPRTPEALEQKIGELERELSRYQKLFEHAPISLWEEDWSEVKRHIDDLRRRGVEDLKAHFDAHRGALEHAWG
jgi:rsbT co-antagonist protein RsbR